MNKINKVAAFFVTAVLVLSIVACGSQETAGSMEPATISQNNGQKIGNTARQEDVYPAQVSYLGEQKWGYIDDAGKFVLQPTFTQANRFQPNSLAVAGEGENIGLIDRKGKYIVEPDYSYINDFHDGLAVAQDDKGFVVLNENGEVISQTHPYIGNYKSNRAAYYIRAQDDKILYGYLDETGKTIIEPVFEYAGEFEGDRAVVKLPDKGYALIDQNGNILKNFNYSYVMMGISDGMMVFSPEQNGKYGYLNTRGDVAIAPTFLIAQNFKDGTAVVNASKDYTVNLYGLIDKKGKFLIKPQYNDIQQLGDGMVALGIAIDANNTFAGFKYALGMQDGRILTDFTYYSIEPFKNGAASVYDNTTSFFIDKTGKRIESLPSAEGIGIMEQLDGLVYADIDQRPYYMNKQGRVVYQPSNSIVLKSGIRVSEEKFRPNRNYLVYYPVLSKLENLKVEEDINIKLRDMWTDVKIKPTDNLDYHYEGNFSIGFNRKNLLVLQESGYDYPFGAAHGMPIMQYVHVNTKTGSYYQLEDLFKDGSNYVEVLSGIVEEQIKEHGEEMGVWQDSYKGIKPDQLFYLTADALMLYFIPYEIAPYAAGFPTFSVPFTEISNIIDKRGSFWLSFN